MANWCLAPHLSTAFLDAIRSGEIDPVKLMDLTSAERRELFARYVGEDNAPLVNAEYESKILLQDQKRGMVNWANKVGGLSEPVRRDIIAKINRMDKVLQPQEEREFLADLAARKLGVTVTAEEAKTIYNLSQRAEAARTTMQQDVSNVDNRIAYGRALMDLTDGVESMKPEGQTFLNRMIDVLSIPKSALTSVLHFSAPFVQGWGMLSTKNAWVGFGKMFQYFADEENYKDLNAWIISHPDYEVAQKARLGLTKLGDKLSAREEAIQSSLLEQANQYLTDKTGVPNAIRASSRAFTGYLNYVRFSRYSDLLNAARLAGEDVRPGSQVSKDIARAVDDFTGRGELGKDDRYSSIGPVLNTIFFAPRKVIATMSMFNPVRYLDPRISPTARKAAIRQLTGSLVATGAVLSLAKAMGASVNPDPRSADFAKIVIGGEKLDMTGGNSGYLRLLGRIVTNQEITKHDKLVNLGESFGAPTRASLVGNYIRGKLSPIAAVLADALYGKDPAGRPFSVTQEMRDKLTPIVMSSFINYFQNDPGNAAALVPSLAAIFGVGLESPLPPMSRSGLSVWGEPLGGSGTPASWRNDPVNQEIDRLGFTPNFPMDSIRGVKLTDDQYQQYVQMSGRLAHMRLGELVQAPSWSAIPSGERLSVMKTVIRKSRDMAATSIMLESQGSSHDIMKLATAAKMSAMGIPQQ